MNHVFYNSNNLTMAERREYYRVLFDFVEPLLTLHPLSIVRSRTKFELSSSFRE